MSRQKGLLLEMENGLAVVLTPDGQYRRVPAGRGWELGQEVQFESALANPPIRRGVAPAWLLAAAVVLLALVVPAALSVQSLFGGQALAAYVAVDINPSLELQVNARGSVLEAQAVNDDAAALLQQLSLKGLPLQQAVQQITEKAIGAGYLSATNDNMVLITVTPGTADKPVPDAVQQQVQASQQAAAAALKNRGLPNQVESLAAPPEVREAAKREGVPTGKLVVASEAARQGVVLSKDELKNEPLTRALEKVGDKAVLEKALEHARNARTKDDLVQAVEQFVTEMGRGQKGDKGLPPGQTKKGGEDETQPGGTRTGGDRQGSGDDARDSGKGEPSGKDGRKDGQRGETNVGPDQQSKNGEDGKDKKDSRSRSRRRKGDAPALKEDAKDSWEEQLRALLDRLFGGDSSQTGRNGDSSGGDREHSGD